jgi:hypothetical protein
VFGPSAHPSAIAAAVVAALASIATIGGCTSQRSAVLGFWFESVTYKSSSFGRPLTRGELTTIANISQEEITRAFDGLRVTVSNRLDARYRVRVLQELRDPRFRGDVAVAGASRAISAFGGDGAVNFSMLAAYAESYAPPEADRRVIVNAIGRGIGRAAVHEFVHQLLGTVRIDDTDDAQSYEYGSAVRRAQYYGDMHWGHAWPALHQRFGGHGTSARP